MHNTLLNAIQRHMQVVSFFFLFVITGFSGFSQSPDCANAPSVTLCNDNEVTINSDQGSWNYTGEYYYMDLVIKNFHEVELAIKSNFQTSGLEHVFKFTPTASGSYSFNVNPQGNADPVPLYETSSPHFKAFYKQAEPICTQAGWTEIGSFGDGVVTAYDQHVLALKAGVTYYFMIDGEAAATGDSYQVNFSLCRAADPVCATATSVILCTNTTANIDAGTGAWDFGAGIMIPGYTGNATPGKEIIYSFTPATTGSFSLVASGNGNPVKYLYKTASGTCDNNGWKEIGTFITSGSVTLPEELEGGTTYYLLLDNGSLGNASQTFQLCPANAADCNSAVIASLCQPLNISIDAGIGAWDFAGNYPVNSVGNAANGKEKLVKFTPTSSGNYSIEVTNATGGYVHYLFKSSANGCNGEGWTGIAKFNAPGGKLVGFLEAGTEYYFVLDNEDYNIASSQTFKICLTPPVNCSPVTGIGLYAQVIASIPSGTGFWDNYAPSTSLTDATAGKELFFRFIAPSTTSYTINQVSGQPVKFYYKAETGDCSNTGWMLFKAETNLTKGTTYIIVADQKGVAENNLVFEVLEDGLFVCPGEPAGMCEQSPFLTGSYIQLYARWYKNNSVYVEDDCVDFETATSAGYGDWYQYQAVARNSIADIEEYNSPVYTIKFRSFWTGAISSAWDNPGNWSCNVVPDGNTDVIIPNTTNKPEIGMNAVVKKIFVLNGASVTVKPSGTLTIKD